ncbi:ASCH domain-containing protein, partial [Brachyspira hyodysenteriae]
LSIKPEYVEKIFNGSKKYEIRKSIFKRKNIKKIIIYSSSPISKVVGEFEIEDIISDDLDNVWNIIKYESGVSVDFFINILKIKK